MISNCDQKDNIQKLKIIHNNLNNQRIMMNISNVHKRLKIIIND